MESPIIISPGNTILFKPSPSGQINSLFTIKNNSISTVCYKIKISSANDFKVSPNSSIIRTKEESTVSVFFIGPQESRNKGQKFLIQIAFASDLKSVDWKSKDVLEFKLGTKFLIADEEKTEARSSLIDTSDLNGSRSQSQSFSKYIEFIDDDSEKLEDSLKKTVTEKKTNFAKEFQKLAKMKKEAEYQYKMKESYYSNITKGTGKYSIPHIILSFVIGLFIGYYLLA